MSRYHPEFPDRRAFFVEGDTQLDIYAYWGDRVAEDLRHEVTHGYLHTMVPHLPLWVDEGLAEYFEVPRGQQGLNPPHRDMLLQAAREQRWRPDMQRLEQLTIPERHDSAGLCRGVGVGAFSPDEYAPTRRSVAELPGADSHDRRGATAVPGPVDG